MKTLTRTVPSLLLGATLLALMPGAQAQSAVSELSAISMLPMAVSVAAPISLLTAGALVTVVAVESTARGTAWVLERASDGARASIQFTGKAIAGSAVLAGAAVVVSVIGTGYVLSAAGEAICLIPNEIGASLLYNERITR